MRFDESLFFVCFVQFQPKTDEQEELIYEQINSMLGYSREAFKVGREKYTALFNTLSQNEILEIKRTARDFDAHRVEIEKEYKEEKINFNEKARRTILVAKEFESKINEILGEPLIEEKKLQTFSLSSLFKTIKEKMIGSK